MGRSVLTVALLFALLSLPSVSALQAAEGSDDLGPDLADSAAEKGGEASLDANAAEADDAAPANVTNAVAVDGGISELDTMAAPAQDPANEKEVEAAEEQAFLAIRNQLSNSREEGSSLRQKLGEALRWGKGMAEQLVKGEQDQKENFKSTIEAERRQEKALAAAARKQEVELEAKLNSSEAEVKVQGTDLATAQRELAEVKHEFAAAKQVWQSTESKLRQDGAAAAQALASRDESVRWLKAREHSQDAELNASYVERSQVLQKAVAKIKEERSHELRLQALLTKEGGAAKAKDASLQQQLQEKSHSLQEARQREEALRGQLAALERREGSEMRNRTQLAQVRVSDETPSSTADQDTTASSEAAPPAGSTTDEDVIEIPY